MPTIKTIQAYAERCARLLGIPDAVKVEWHDGTHPPKNTTHCHLEGERGRICIRRADLNRSDWRWLVAHEVCHLAVKDHDSPYFALRMVRLGVATPRERRRAVVAGLVRHRHDWTAPYAKPTGGYGRRCIVCGAEQVGDIRWGKIIPSKPKTLAKRGGNPPRRSRGGRLEPEEPGQEADYVRREVLLP